MTPADKCFIYWFYGVWACNILTDKQALLPLPDRHTDTLITILHHTRVKVNSNNIFNIIHAATKNNNNNNNNPICKAPECQKTSVALNVKFFKTRYQALGPELILVYKGMDRHSGGPPFRGAAIPRAAIAGSLRQSDVCLWLSKVIEPRG